MRILFLKIDLMIKLDKIDVSILRSLQEHGRMTNVDLATTAGISAPPCLRRLKSLEKKGVISGYHADINPSAIGYNFEAFCLVSLDSQTASDIDYFINEIRKLKNVRSCTSVVGLADFILRIVAHDFKNFEYILANNISKIKNISQIKTLVVMKTHKKESDFPIEII